MSEMTDELRARILAEYVAVLEGTDDVRVITQHGKPVAVIADYRHFRNLEDGFFPDEDEEPK